MPDDLMKDSLQTGSQSPRISQLMEVLAYLPHGQNHSCGTARDFSPVSSMYVKEQWVTLEAGLRYCQ